MIPLMLEKPAAKQGCSSSRAKLLIQPHKLLIQPWEAGHPAGAQTDRPTSITLALQIFHRGNEARGFGVTLAFAIGPILVVTLRRYGDLRLPLFAVGQAKPPFAPGDHSCPSPSHLGADPAALGAPALWFAQSQVFRLKKSVFAST
jgi:hypothetical protein